MQVLASLASFFPAEKIRTTISPALYTASVVQHTKNAANMLIFDYLYTSYYSFSGFFKRNIPGSFLYNQRFDSLVILSLFVNFNISSLWLYLDLPPMFTNHTFDFFIGFVIITGLNTFYFEYKSRYLKVIAKFQNNYLFINSWIYSILSIIVFFYFQSKT
jgi:hypothetical protein